jgi:hypothetical protein
MVGYWIMLNKEPCKSSIHYSFDDSDYSFRITKQKPNPDVLELEFDYFSSQFIDSYGQTHKQSLSFTRQEALYLYSVLNDYFKGPEIPESLYNEVFNLTPDLSEVIGAWDTPEMDRIEEVFK